MEQALYHPEWGYYSSGRCAIGRRGDFFTSVSVGSLFGTMLTAQFVEMWEILGRPDRFTIVEQGANNGDLAADVLRAAATLSPDFNQAARYLIVEPFPALQRRQLDKLADFGGQVSWRKTLNDLEPFAGVHFSNELLDAMPVHLLRNDHSGWEELFVGERDGEFHFVRLRLSNSKGAEHVAKLPPLPIGYETEVNLVALAWQEELSRKLARGWLLTADYGHVRQSFYAPERSTGTLRCSMQRRVVPSPLNHAGHADITAHVEWTSIAECGLAHGLDLAGFADQHHFLSALATGLCREQFTPLAGAQTRRQLQALLHPTLLGRTFQFLALSRGIAPDQKLDGFRLASDPRRALGL